MARIGFCGLGKLGSPVAYAFASKGHEIVGYDTNPDILQNIEAGYYPHQEEGMQKLMVENHITIARSIHDLVAQSDMIFVPVQTPHDPKYEGATRLPEERKDFDYTYLIKAVGDLATETAKQKKHIDLVIISTTLPGTVNREIKPLLNEYTHLAYEPMFIAMGTVIEDVLNPEFTLIGVDEPEVADRLEAFHRTIHNAPALRTDITTAEAIKVSYNTFITTKTVLGNLWGEIAHKTGANVDDIYKAWKLSTDRLISPKYLKSGVGDGGGCHPRDNIALSWLAEKIDLSFNYFDALMKARELHMEWIAGIAQEAAEKEALPIFILGEAFKPETRLTTGSPAVLLKTILSEDSEVTVLPEPQLPTERGVYVIGVEHKMYEEVVFPDGSVIIDPFRFLTPREGVEYIQIGLTDKSN